MKANIKAKWVKALRSGKYKQGKGHLRTADNKFCCLGVLTDLYIKEDPKTRSWTTREGMPYAFDGEADVLPVEVRDWAGLDDTVPNVCTSKGVGTDLAAMNDGSGWGIKRSRPFSAIAGVIEKQL